MSKIFCLLLTICSVVSAFSQNPISVEKIINDLDWENCTESDVILAFKDNIVSFLFHLEKCQNWYIYD